MAMLDRDGIKALGFQSAGENLKISKKASFHGANRIVLGSNVRIDDFCVLSAGEGGIFIGSYVHIGVYSCLIGAGKILLSDFCNISSRVSIYSSNDDYSGASMTNPTVLDKYKKVNHAEVFLGKHVIVGSGSVILPGVILEQGVAVGALSLINKTCQEFGVYVGNPARRIKNRKRDLLELELQMQKLEK
jgi:acetyltransferase-like isoleucine patch superfamily enzyme